MSHTSHTVLSECRLNFGMVQTLRLLLSRRAMDVGSVSSINRRSSSGDSRSASRGMASSWTGMDSEVDDDDACTLLQ